MLFFSGYVYYVYTYNNNIYIYNNNNNKMKTKVTLNCDIYLLEQARNNNVNLSQSLEDNLRFKLSYMDNNSNKIDVKLTKIEIEKEEKNIAKSQVKLSKLRQNLAKYEENIAKKDQERLQKEAEIIKSKTTCFNCGCDLTDKWSTKLAPGLLCKGCFFGMDKDQLKKWNKPN